MAQRFFPFKLSVRQTRKMVLAATHLRGLRCAMAFRSHSYALLGFSGLHSYAF
jgi:hypothetical protein